MSNLDFMGRIAVGKIQEAIEEGKFDNLPGTGKPIPGLDAPHDPDWWLKRLIEREHITGVLPPALALRTEDSRMDATLDRETTPDGVCLVVEDFNARVVEARRQHRGGPVGRAPLGGQLGEKCVGGLNVRGPAEGDRHAGLVGPRQAGAGGERRGGQYDGAQVRVSPEHDLDPISGGKFSARGGKVWDGVDGHDGREARAHRSDPARPR